MSRYTVEVFAGAGVFDAAGRETLRNIAELGITGVTGVTIVTLYRLEGDLTEAGVRRIARELLVDRVSQEFRVARGAPRVTGKGRYAEVWLKPGVTDPVAETAGRAIRDIGVGKPVSVATGVRYLFEGRITRRTADAICRKLLVNDLIHEHRVG